MEFGNAVMAGGRCDRCDGPISNTRVIVTLAAEDKAEIRATLCMMGCAMEWLGMTREEVLSFKHPQAREN